MSQSIENKLSRSGKELRKKTYVSALEKIKAEVEENGSQEVFYDVMRKYLEDSNVEPVYEQERDNSEVELMRERLNTEPGVIISNHPGYFDGAAIFNLIHRPDLLVMVSPENYQAFAKAFGSDKFVEAAHQPMEAFQQFKKIMKHIEAGGALLIFPTAGSDAIDKRKDGDSLHFEGGFASLLNKLSPDDMVYSFHIDPDDVAAAVGEAISRQAGVVSQAHLGDGININRFKDRKAIRVNEAYSTARAWQEAAGKKTSKEEANDELAQYYLKQFKQLE